MILSSYVTVFLLVWDFICLLSDGFNIDIKDTVKLQGFLDPGSYFGYSVALSVSQNAGNQWILVGAPRSKDPSFPDVPRPGAVFACTLPSQGKSTCTKLDIDETKGFDDAVIGGETVYFRHGRNDSWLGGSIDVSTSGSSDVLATCAHKWYDTSLYVSRDLVSMQGMCYEVPLDLNMANVKKLPALTRRDFRVIYRPETKRYVFNYGFGGLGISVHYTKNGDHLLLGATGLLDWIGGFVDVEGNQVKVMQDEINTTDIIRPYVGYSSTSGMYFSDGQTYFAIGAPREDLRGMVLFFRAGEAKHVLQNTAVVLQGRENGVKLPANSYYGATLCTMDVNNDNKDDLLVGAPMYSLMTNRFFTEEPEVGMVFLYLGSKTSMRFQTPPQILKGTEVYGRFGSSIANLGDINSDSYSDVAIGAPYENDLKGAVYIYNGYSRGVWPKFSQRILASDIDTGLRGFGISIASGKDINSDNINDMVVGSYLSDQAVVMFGQPVITVDAQLNVVDSKGLVTEYIKVGKHERESAIICFRYVDQRCGYMKMNVTMSLDVGYDEKTRMAFAANNETSISSEIEMLSGDLKCSTPTKILTKSMNDLVSKIEVQADYVMQEISCPGLSVGATVSHFNGARPGDPILQIRRTLQFKNDCPNNLCRTNLTLLAEASYENVSGNFVIGNQDLNIDVVVAKTGDLSYGSVFYMAYPKYLGYKNMQKLLGEEDDITCSLIDSGSNDTGITLEENESAISCLFGNPMRNDTGVHFRLFFKVPVSFASSDTTMMMHLSVTTLSEELQPTDNNQTIINLSNNLETTFTAISTQEQIYLEERKNTYNMENIYELYNKGPSELQSSEIKIAFPQLQYSGKAALYLNKTEIRCDHDCKAKCSFVQKQTTPTIYSYFRGQLVSKTQTPEATLSDIQNNDCRQQKCSYFVCTITNIQAKSGAVLYMHFIIDREIEGGIKEGKSMTLTSVAEVQINKTNLISNQTEFSQQVSTSVRRKRTAVKEELQWWIILVSALGGFLLIVLIALVLWKVGFFKRKKRDELEKRKSCIPDSGNKVTSEKKRNSYTDSEGAIVDNEIPPGSNNEK